MAIEFECKHCGTVLRTTDDKAGKKAKCPGCGDVIAIPAGGSSRTASGGGRRRPRRDEWDEQYGEADDDYDEFDDEDDDRSSGGGRSTCPMCGERVSAKASRCRHCGENLRQGGRSRDGGTHGFEVGETISTAWDIFQVEWGLCLGALLLPAVINLALQFGSQLLLGLIAAVLAKAMGEAGIYVFSVLAIVWMVGVVLFALFINAGQILLMVNIARGRSNGISDLFAGGPFVGRLFLNAIVLALCMFPLGLIVVLLGFVAEELMMVGVIILYVGIFIVMLAIWPFTYALVDQDLRGLQPLTEAWRLTQGYRLTTLLLFLLLGLINVGGALACGIGLLITMPLSMLSLAVAYCRLAGRRVVV